jgi:predicted enzyme related to lactoylglutathione lyase
MTRVVHFEMESKDPEKKMVFYQEVFNWSFQKISDEYWMIITGEHDQPGINGGLLKSASEESLRTVNTISVPKLDEYLKKVEMAGGNVVSPKMSMPNVGDFAYCVDVDGLSFGVIEFTMKQ